MELAAMSAIKWTFKSSSQQAGPLSDGKSVLKILSRHHFVSQLQRMSSVCELGSGKKVVVCKGSPEALKLLLAPGCEPRWFESGYRSLSRDGYRVLGLAYKYVGAGAEKWSREEFDLRVCCRVFLDKYC